MTQREHFKKKVIIIVGPTAVGKTALAIRVAKHFQTEIISADSRQCYRELNIGVARPSPEELKIVPHHFIASHSIHDSVTAADFESFALSLLTNLFKQNDIVVVAGGTGLYVKAIMEGLDDIPQVDPIVREEIQANYIHYGLEWLVNEIKNHDPLYAASHPLQNPQRLMRALEVAKTTGKSILSFQSKSPKQRPFDMIPVYLELPRAALYERINHRVDIMMQNGLLEEVQALFDCRNLNALQTVGYTELFAHIEGKISIEEAVDKIKQHTRHFAKRQVTWFKHQLKASSFHQDDVSGLIDYVS
ncbi:MAG: tRNA (adenosine(37)-N6)-dimethylallyltransferase MiaA [Bacteroidetes bacterium]|nr:tRNA (adenosine(37)-N6)-dimethylallyltransferase MiaA [Bacteroidota bacterium]